MASKLCSTAALKFVMLLSGPKLPPRCATIIVLLGGDVSMTLAFGLMAFFARYDLMSVSSTLTRLSFLPICCLRGLTPAAVLLLGVVCDLVLMVGLFVCTFIFNNFPSLIP